MSIITAIAKDSSKYNKVLANHEALLVTISKKDITFPISSLSISRINGLTGDSDEAIEKIIYSVLLDTNNNKTFSSEKQYDIQRNIIKILQTNKYYNIYTAKVQMLPEEISNNLIKISMESMQKMTRMIQLPWLEFINYFSIEINLPNTSQRKKDEVKSEANRRLKRLLKKLSLFSIIFSDQQIVDISSYSMKTIMKMKDEGLYTLAKLLTLVIITYKEYKVKASKNRRIINLVNNMILKEEVEKNEQSASFNMKKTVDYSFKLPKSSLNNFEIISKQASNALLELRNKVNNKKQALKEYCNSNNSFILVPTVNEKKDFIKRKVLMEIVENKEKYAEKSITVKDINGEEVEVVKPGDDDDDNKWRNSNEYIHLLNSDESIILIDKEQFNSILINWKSIAQFSQIKNVIDNTETKVNLYNIKIPNESEELDKLKFKLRKVINDSDCIMIEVHKGEIIPYNAYDYIMSSDSDEFNVLDCLNDSKKIKITKKCLDDFIIKESLCFVKVISQGQKNKEVIVSKSLLLESIDQAQDCEKNIVINDYNNQEIVIKLKDLHVVPISGDIYELNQVTPIKQKKSKRSAHAMDIYMTKESFRPEGGIDEGKDNEEEHEVEIDLNESIEQLKIPSPEKPKMKTKEGSSGKGKLIRTKVYKRTKIS